MEKKSEDKTETKRKEKEREEDKKKELAVARGEVTPPTTQTREGSLVVEGGVLEQQAGTRQGC